MKKIFIIDIHLKIISIILIFVVLMSYNVISIKNHNHRLGNYFKHDMVIISPKRFSNSVQSLINHKNNVGIKTILKTTEEIFSEYNGRDEAEKIKYFIFDAKEIFDINYVLFIGGKENIPIRYLTSPINLTLEVEKNNPTYLIFSKLNTVHSKKFICDLYYADIYNETGDFEDWDSNNNNIFGEINKTKLVDKIDFYPDVCLGRLPCSDDNDVKLIINKIINYEKNISFNSWFNNIILCGGDTHPNIYEEISWLLNLLSHGYLCGIAWEGEYTCNNILDMIGDFNPIKCYASGIINYQIKKLSVENINNALNEGAGFFVYSGHGYGNGFSTHFPFINFLWIPYPSNYEISDISQLNNSKKLPVAVFSACFCADFLNFKNPIASEFITNENGGSIASLACTTISYTPLTTYTTEAFNGFLTTKFFELYAKGEKILGKIWLNSISDYLKNQDKWLNLASEDYWHHYLSIEEWILLGDPSLKIGGYS